jgi:hypothetical protein
MADNGSRESTEGCLVQPITRDAQGTIKGDGLVPVPPGVVTEIGPVFAPFGTVVVITVSELELMIALLPANITLVAPVKFDPLIVTGVPAVPCKGVKPLIVGAAITVKFVPLIAIPWGVVTTMGPVVAPMGTVAMIFMPLNLNIAMVPLKVTPVAVLRFVPLIVTEVLIPPLVGEKLVIVGGAPATTVKFVALVAVPPIVVTPIGPVVAPDGTIAVI